MYCIRPPSITVDYPAGDLSLLSGGDALEEQGFHLNPFQALLKSLKSVDAGSGLSE